jgi:SAM-dependent methyltransferase
MTAEDEDADADRLAAESLRRGDPTGWFEPLYDAAGRGEAVVPWDRGEPHPLLVEWAAQRAEPAPGVEAVVVGCGLGEDAELLARLGYDTVAFDVSPTAVEACRARHPGSSVRYQAADLLDLPAAWTRAYGLVVEVFTVQALPSSLRTRAVAAVAGLVAPRGRLVVIAFAGEAGVEADGPPWPISRHDLDGFVAAGLELVRLELLETGSGPRWRAEYTR